MNHVNIVHFLRVGRCFYQDRVLLELTTTFGTLPTDKSHHISSKQRMLQVSQNNKLVTILSSYNLI